MNICLKRLKVYFFASLLVHSNFILSTAQASDTEQANTGQLVALQNQLIQLKSITSPVAVVDKGIILWQRNSKSDWQALYKTCADFFELRNYSVISDCVEIAKRWRQNAREAVDERALILWDTPVYPKLMLFKARAYLEQGQLNRAIELTG